MRVRAIAVGSGVAMALAVGCGAQGPAPTPEPVGRTSSAIQGGTVDTKDTYAVGVCATTSGPGTCAVVCSGVLLAPNLVATARHCVDEVSSTTVYCGSDSFGGLVGSTSDYWITTSDNLFQATQGWHQARQIIVPTDTSFCGNDLALLILSDNVPASDATPATPEIQYPITDPTRFSGSETAIGYGITAPGTMTSGTRRELEDVEIVCIPGDSVAPCAPVAMSNIAENEFAAGNGPCDGDSGSGAFEQNAYNMGEALALGVLSRGGVMGESCSGSVYTRFDTWHDLIVQTVTTAASLGGYPLPSWTAPAPPSADDAGTDAAPDADDAGCEADGAPCTGAQRSSSGGCASSPAEPGRGAWLFGLGLGVVVAGAARTRRSRGVVSMRTATRRPSRSSTIE